MTPEKTLEEMYPILKKSRFFPSKNFWQWIILFACGIFIIFIILGTLLTAFGEEIDIPAIIQIESAGNTYAISEDNCIGLMQLSKSVVDDFNKYSGYKSINSGWYPLPISHNCNMLCNGRANKDIGIWYINIRIPQLLKYYKLEDTIEARLACYNAGIGTYLKYKQGKIKKLPAETINYIRKYKNLTRGK